MAGMVSSYLQGIGLARQHQSEDEARRLAAEERMYQRGRRAQLDQREDLAFDQGQEDRARRIGDYEEDRDYLTTVERPRAARIADRQERVAQFKEDRMPIEAQREDQEFLWKMDDNKRRARESGLREQLLQYGLDDKRLEHEVRMAQEAFKPAVAAYARTRDPRVFAEWANETVAKDDPIAITQREDGSWMFQSRSGQPQVLGTADDVMRVARTLTHPDVFLEFQASQAKTRAELAAAQAEAEAKDPSKFWELVNDENGALMQIDQRTGQARQVMRDGGQGPLIGTKAGAFGSRAGELTLGVRRPGQQPSSPVVFSEAPATPPSPEARARASQLATGRAPAPQQRAAAPPEGARVRGPDGRIYVVRNGQPVLVTQ